MDNIENKVYTNDSTEIIRLHSIDRLNGDMGNAKKEGIPLEKGVVLTEEFLEKNEDLIK